MSFHSSLFTVEYRANVRVILTESGKALASRSVELFENKIRLIKSQTSDKGEVAFDRVSASKYEVKIENGEEFRIHLYVK